MPAPFAWAAIPFVFAGAVVAAGATKSAFSVGESSAPDIKTGFCSFRGTPKRAAISSTFRVRFARARPAISDCRARPSESNVSA